MTHKQESDADQPEIISKTKRKRQMLDLQKMGETLVELPAHQLAKIPLQSGLAEAIETARSLSSREAKRRQLQYIGRLMRNVDAQPIKEALDKIQHKTRQGNAEFHQIERWRDRLIDEGDSLLQEFLNQYPHADHQRLRQLIRKSQNTKQKNSGAETELFRYLRDVLENTP